VKITILIGILALIAFDSTVVTSESQAKVQVGQKFPPAKHRRARAHNPYERLEPYRSMDFIGAYPGEYARRRALGECVFDLGYGRLESC